MKCKSFIEETYKASHFIHQELAERFAPQVSLSVSGVGDALESIRVQAVNRGKGNKTFRETNVATLELVLPKDARKVKTWRLFLTT